MPRNSALIAVNKFGDESDTGISIERISFNSLPDLGDWEQPERHDRHSFFLLEHGTVTMEIDFQLFDIHSPSIIYMHPDQVHRIIAFKDVTVSAWAANDQHLNTEYLKLLDEITPSPPLALNRDLVELLSDAASLCLKLADRKKDKLYYSLLKDSLNTLVGLLISVFRESCGTTEKLIRAEIITKHFREALGKHFISLKRPTNYAEKLHISVPYLNECVKEVTGHPVSYHIQQRIILEAKRLLYHSNRSLKEIAASLGYDDYTYFSRLFTKVEGMSPATFRHKNLD
jgi:AraC family transcriptional activator of pobA